MNWTGDPDRMGSMKISGRTLSWGGSLRVKMSFLYNPKISDEMLHGVAEIEEQHIRKKPIRQQPNVFGVLLVP